MGVSQRPRTVVTASEKRLEGLRLNRTRAIWDAEDIDVLPQAPPGRYERKTPPPRR